MTWGKVSDRLHAHSKARRAREAMALWVLALSWCCDELTDGAVPSDMPELLIPGGDAMAEKLVSVGLWERAEAGFRFHDWAEYQPSADEERERRAAVSKVRSEAGKRGNAKRWGDRSQPDSKHFASASQNDRKTIANGSQTDRPVPDPEPKNPSPNPLPQAEGGSEVSQDSKPKSDERPAPTATCTTREHLGTDPHEVALTLGASVPRLRHFPGGARDDFRRVSAPLRIEWPVLAAWFAAGGTRRHRSERVTWSWLLGHGGAPLAECWALAQEWASKGRPSLDERGEIAAPKPAPEAKPSSLRVVPAPLAWLEGAPERISPEAIERAKAKALAKVANGR